MSPANMTLEESNPEERLNKVIELVDNDNIGKDENKLKETLLHIAAFEGFEDSVEELIKRKVQLDYRCDKVLTPLHLVIQNNHFNIVKTLVKYGVNVNEFSLIRQSSSDLAGEENILKITPFELAFEYKNFRIINLLLENKVEISKYSNLQIDGLFEKL